MIVGRDLPGLASLYGDKQSFVRETQTCDRKEVKLMIYSKSGAVRDLATYRWVSGRRLP